MASKKQVLDSLYHYRAEVVSVYDGDTCTLDIDLGMDVWIRGAEKVTGRESRDYSARLDRRQCGVAAVVQRQARKVWLLSRDLVGGKNFGEMAEHE